MSHDVWPPQTKDDHRHASLLPSDTWLSSNALWGIQGLWLSQRPNRVWQNSRSHQIWTFRIYRRGWCWCAPTSMQCVDHVTVTRLALMFALMFCCVCLRFSEGFLWESNAYSFPRRKCWELLMSVRLGNFHPPIIKSASVHFWMQPCTSQQWKHTSDPCTVLSRVARCCCSSLSAFWQLSCFDAAGLHPLNQHLLTVGVHTCICHSGHKKRPHMKGLSLCSRAAFGGIWVLLPPCVRRLVPPVNPAGLGWSEPSKLCHSSPGCSLTSTYAGGEIFSTQCASRISVESAAYGWAHHCLPPSHENMSWRR